MGNAGRVLMIPKGDYNASTTYEMLDCVYYNGRSYVCKQRSTGHAPTDTTYWQPMTPDSSAEIQALTNQLEDEAETRAALGAHNLGYVVNQSLTGNYRLENGGSSLIAKVDKNTSYIVTKKQGQGNRFRIVGFINEPSEVLEPTAVELYSNSSAYSYTVNSGSFNYLVLTYESSSFIVQDTAEAMIRLATDSDPTYQPYAKTNAELTQDVETIVSQIEVASGITLQDNKVIKCGDVVHVYFEITSPPDTTGGNVVIGTIPFLPRTNFSFINAYSRSNPFEIKHTVFIRGNNGEVVFPTGVTSSGVFVEGTFICK